MAPDGTIDWLCVPRFDAPSVFGSLLDRQAGGFRLGPYGFNVPAARRYEPGTNALVTSRHVPGGWVEVRDALTVGPRRGPDTITPHTRPPADDDAGHVLARTVTRLDFPQAFSHLALLEAAARIILAERLGEYQD